MVQLATGQYLLPTFCFNMALSPFLHMVEFISCFEKLCFSLFRENILKGTFNDNSLLKICGRLAEVKK